MELALYAPGLGYYAAGATKLGAAGDFVTAPEMTPLFAQALAAQVAAILAATERREIVELGGGSGRLAADLLQALAARDALPSRYAILEPSAPTCASASARRSRAMRQRTSRASTGSTRCPRAIDGAVIANEVLDAMPVHVVARRGERWLERGVGVERRTRSASRGRIGPPTRASPRSPPQRFPAGRRLHERDQSGGRGAGRGHRPPAACAAPRSSSTTAFPPPSTTTRSATRAR